MPVCESKTRKSQANDVQDRLCAAQGVHLCRLREASALPSSYRAVALSSFVLLAGATLPTPLYQTYSETFSFSEFTLTLIFAIYALGVIPALFIFGPVGDAICRRRVLMAAICIEAAGIGFLSIAQGVAWLLAGRLFVGIAVGVSQGNSSAALVEMQPDGDRRRAGVMTTASTIGGAATGPLISGFMGQYLPDPLLLCYVVEICLLVLALFAVALIPEASGPITLSSIGIHRPNVSRGILARFVRASVSGGLSWSIAGIFVALVPSYVSRLLGDENLAIGGALVAMMLGSSVAGQLAMRNQPAFRLQVCGMAGAIAGMAAIVLAWPLASLTLMFIGSIVCGACTGMAYLGSISELNQLAEPEERGSTNSLYFVIVYLFFAVPAVALGLIATYWGLFPSVVLFSAILSVLAVADIIWITGRRTA
ncbi:MAG TPA: MFS transporter [Syntrophales bacterium]|nr:MFS transporter [Syntrophales bacterium]